MQRVLLNPTVLRASIAVSSLMPFASRAESSCPTDVRDGGSLTISQGVNCSKGNSSANNLFGQTGVFHQIANVLIFLVGAIAVIMLIIGGLRYVISQGDKTNVESAKNTILYAVIGIVIAILAYAIVNFVVGSLANSNNAGQ